MPELRRDPIVGRWVIIAAERGVRPSDFTRRSPSPERGAFCPFCPGHESATPPEVFALRTKGPANSTGWRLRVVPNRFPALMIEGDLDRQGAGMFDRMNGVGAHEVVIETSAHDKTLADFTPQEMEETLTAYRERIRDLRQDRRFRSIMVFKNHGEAAGATLEHSHSQIIALPVVPSVVQAEMEGSRRTYELKERCVFCDIIFQEIRDGARVIYENSHALAIAPWAPRSPFELWVLPKGHASHFEETTNEVIEGAADVLRRVLRRLDRALEKPPYNFILHSAPLSEGKLPWYHWHLEVVPTLSQVAGFEWGSGFHINPTPPEVSAAFLRRLED